MPLNIDLTNKQKTVLMTIGIMLLGLLLGRIVVYKGNFEKVKRIQAKIEEQKKINKLVAQIGEVEDKLAVYKQMMAEIPDPNWLLNRLDEMAKETGVKIESIDSVKPETTGSFTFLKCNLRVTAPYHKLGFFISKVESNKRMMWIEGLEMSPIRKEGLGLQETAGIERPAAPEAGEIFERSEEGGMWMNATIQVSSCYAG